MHTTNDKDAHVMHALVIGLFVLSPGSDIVLEQQRKLSTPFRAPDLDILDTIYYSYIKKVITK